MYNFFIDGVQLPVSPSNLTTIINNKNETITLMNEGEVNILKKPGLTDIEFEVLLPNVQYPFAVYPDGYKQAAYYLDKIERLKLSQNPFQFIVNRLLPNKKLLFDTNISVALEDYTILEDAEENGFDVKVRINLKQYRSYGTKKIKVQAKVSASSSSPKATVEKKREANNKTTPKTHTVVDGDTLWAISKRYLRDGNKYPELAKINNISNPNLIKAGQVIKLE